MLKNPLYIEYKFDEKQFKAFLTQLAEYWFCKPKVIGSTPIEGLFILLML